MFWVYILFAGKTSGGLPFCDCHRGYWTRRAWFIVVGFAGLIVLMIVASALTPPVAPTGQQGEPHWLFGLVGGWMLVFLPTFLVLQLSATRPTGGTRKSLVLSGSSHEFAAAVNEERDRAAPGQRGTS